MSEYAPEYTKREKAWFIVKHLSWASPLVLVTQLWFFPWFEGYVKQAHCYDYGLFTGSQVVFYGLFTGLPAILVLTIFLFEGRRHLRILKLGQSPLPNEKVLNPTKYKYGVRAKIQSYLFFILLIAVIGLGVKGMSSAKKIIQTIAEDKNLECPT